MTYEWQPIETAPKEVEGWDNPGIIVWGPDCQVQGAYWMKDWYGKEDKACWMPVNLDEEYGGPIYPTHWMPWPEPPTEQEEVEQFE